MGKNSRKERSRRYKAKLKRDKGLGSCKNRLRVKNKKLTRMVVKRRKDEKAEEISTERTRFVVGELLQVGAITITNPAQTNHALGRAYPSNYKLADKI